VTAPSQHIPAGQSSCVVHVSCPSASFRRPLSELQLSSLCCPHVVCPGSPAAAHAAFRAQPSHCALQPQSTTFGSGWVHPPPSAGCHSSHPVPCARGLLACQADNRQSRQSRLGVVSAGCGAMYWLLCCFLWQLDSLPLVLRHLRRYDRHFRLVPN
jgi:hypothetical protein